METLKSDKAHRIVLATPAPISHRTAEENLGLGYLTAILRKNNYPTEIVDGWLEKLTPEQIANRINKPPLPLFVGFSAYRSNMSRAMETIKILKANGFPSPIIAGGFGPTFHSDDFLNAGFDYVLRGEGDQSILDFANFLTTGQPNLEGIGGLSYRLNGEIHHNLVKPLDFDIDQIPFPVRDTMHITMSRRTPVHMMSARGCQAHCTFCSIIAFQKLGHGPQWRQRSIDNFVEEAADLYGQGVRHVKVIDDSFIEPPRDLEWVTEFADKMSARGLDMIFRSSVRADRLTSDIVRELKRAGFIGFSCGVENFSPTALKRMGKTATLEQNIAALQAFKEHGLIMQQGMILFDHGTTIEELEQNYQGMREHDHTVIKGVFTEMFAAEGTPFTKLLGTKGLLREDPSGLGNHKYLIEDDRVRIAYNSLKQWHKAHARIYDTAIDPVSAPKAISPEEMQMFMPFVKDLRHKDLDVMRAILDAIKQGASEAEIQQYVDDTIQKDIPWYQSIKLRIDTAYQVAGLVYDADDNPFICD